MVHRGNRDGLFGRMGRYFVPAMTLAIVIGQQLFFSFGFFIQIVFPSFEVEGLYSIYLAALAVFAFLLFAKRVIVDSCRLPGMAWSFLCLAALIAVSTLIHRNEYSSVWDFFVYFVVICLPALATGITLSRREGSETLGNMVKLIDPAMIVVTVAVCAYELINYSEGFTNRALAGVTYQQVSYMGALAFGMNCAMLLTERKHRFRLFQTGLFGVVQVAMLVIQAICVVLSGGRGGFVLMCVYGMIFVVQFAKKAGRNVIGLSVFPLLLLVLLGLVASGVIDLSGMVDTRGFERIFTFRDNRSEVFGPAFDIISQHFLLGCGVGGYFNDLGVYPHNMILELLLNWGVLGLILALAILIIAIRRLGRIFAADERLFPLAYIAMSPVVFLMLSSSFMANATLWFFVGLAFSPLSLNHEGGLSTPPFVGNGKRRKASLAVSEHLSLQKERNA